MFKRILITILCISLIIFGRTLWTRSVDTTMAVDQMTNRSDVYTESRIITQNLFDLGIITTGFAGAIWVLCYKKGKKVD